MTGVTACIPRSGYDQYCNPMFPKPSSWRESKCWKYWCLIVECHFRRRGPLGLDEMVKRWNLQLRKPGIVSCDQQLVLC